MSKYLGKSGMSYELIEPAWKNGGEGYIYRIKGNPNIVAKIFKSEKLSSTQQRKLEMMSKASMNEIVNKQTTWPQDLLYQSAWDREVYKPIGYTMKLVSNAELLCEINGPSHENMSRNQKWMIAINMCSAVNAIHSIGHVIGDMNPRNIMINNSDYMVTLIDTDSYHIIDDVTHREYRCNVGMGEYIAPELMKRMQHGERLDSLELPTYTKETDNFALAIHIFTLLMDGWHPFTCRLLESAPDSVPCPQKKDNILTGYSPYFSSQENYGIPRKSPRLESLPVEIQKLFRQAFVDGYNYPAKRPKASVWEMELRRHYGMQMKEEPNAEQIRKQKDAAEAARILAEERALKAQWDVKRAEEDAEKAKKDAEKAKREAEQAKREAQRLRAEARQKQKEIEKIKRKNRGKKILSFVIVLLLLYFLYSYFVKQGNAERIINMMQSLNGFQGQIGQDANLNQENNTEANVDENNINENDLNDTNTDENNINENQMEDSEMTPEQIVSQENPMEQTPVPTEMPAAVETTEESNPIHQYEYVIEDVTWQQAYEACLARGGHLVTFETEEEYEYILNEIVTQGYGNIKFFIGARREVEADSKEYYWLNQYGQSYGACLNDSSHWMAKEPSFEDEAVGIQEYCVDMFYYSNEDRWVWNDIPEDISKYYTGSIGYICEFER